MALTIGLGLPRMTAIAPAAMASPAPGVIAVSAVIESPMESVVVARPAVTVVAAVGQTVDALAAVYHSDAAAIRWANQLGPAANPPAGAELVLPPGPGVLVAARTGETPTAFASRLGLDPRVLLDYNELPSNAPLPLGSYLQVPMGAAPRGALIAERFAVGTDKAPEVAPSQAPDTFAYGQCTWYVASRRAVTWGGNADEWYQKAAARGFAEGHVPVAGAIVAFWPGGDGASWQFGHVAYVEGVGPADGLGVGMFRLSQTDFDGSYSVSYRILPDDSAGIQGFIYGQ